MSIKLLKEFFGIESEATDAKQAERELNSSQSVFARKPSGNQTSTKSTAQAQADVNAGSSVAKKEAAGDASATGLRVSGDKETLGALMDALNEAENSISDNEDLADWCGKAWKIISRGLNSGSVTLPPFQRTPDIDSFNDDNTGIGPDDSEEF